MEADSGAMVDGIFVVFEGIDGSGTTTQATMLHEAFVRLGRRSVLTSEPTAGPIGNVIRQIMTRRFAFSSDAKVLDRFLAYLFAADRFDHVHNEIDGILSYLKNGVDVISTRYYFSSLAYHVTSPGDIGIVRSLNSEFCDPDLTVYLDCPVPVALERLARSRQLTEHYENAEKLRLASSNYERIWSSFKGAVVRIDATKPRDEQHESIINAARPLIRARTASST